MRALSFSEQYESQGYIKLPEAVEESALAQLEPVLWRFHQRWLRDHREDLEQGVLNSAYLTREQGMTADDRKILFAFIGGPWMRDLITRALPGPAIFVGTQLFFDPLDSSQTNYWHRDIQYRQQPVEEQKAFIKTANVLHVRVALKPERGIELVPGTHRRWDDQHEFDVRMAQNGRAVHDPLPAGVTVPLHRGDALLFSGAMIHRGLYGQDRFAFDVLFGDADAQIAQSVPSDCLPGPDIVETIEWQEPFEATRELLAQSSDVPP